MKEFYYMDTGEIVYAKQITIDGMQKFPDNNAVRACVGDWVVLESKEYRIVSAQAFDTLFCE